MMVNKNQPFVQRLVFTCHNCEMSYPCWEKAFCYFSVYSIAFMEIEDGRITYDPRALPIKK